MIGVLDSGVGGLFVLHSLNLHKQGCIYFADQKHFPYGDKSLPVVRALLKKNVQFLVDQGATTVLVACNTASAVLENAQQDPVPVLGVITPALKQAKKMSTNKQVGVLATKGTVKSNIFIKKAQKVASNLKIHQQACPKLAPFVQGEKEGWSTLHSILGKGGVEIIPVCENSTKSDGELNLKPDYSNTISVKNMPLGSSSDPKERKQKCFSLLQEYIPPLLNKGVDTIILACTHYLYLKPDIEKYLRQKCPGHKIHLVGPIPFLAKKLKELLNLKGQPYLAPKEAKPLSTPYVKQKKPSPLNTTHLPSPPLVRVFVSVG